MPRQRRMPASPSIDVMALWQMPVLAKPGSYVIRPVRERSAEMSRASPPSVPSATGSSSVWSPNVSFAVRVIVDSPPRHGLDRIGNARDRGRARPDYTAAARQETKGRRGNPRGGRPAAGGLRIHIIIFKIQDGKFQMCRTQMAKSG